MTNKPDALPHAITLASTGQFLTIAEVKRHMKREGYKTDVIGGKKLTAQLLQLMTRAQLTAA